MRFINGECHIDLDDVVALTIEYGDGTIRRIDRYLPDGSKMKEWKLVMEDE